MSCFDEFNSCLLNNSVSVDPTISGTVSHTLNAESTGGEKQTSVADHVFIAFARVFSGTIRKGQMLYVLGPKHDPSKALEVVSLILSGCSFKVQGKGSDNFTFKKQLLALIHAKIMVMECSLS